MNREELEARVLEILASGREPMDVPDIREAVAADPAIADEIEGLRRFTDSLGDMHWPELDRHQNVDYMARAFEEGFRQGRAIGARSVPRRHGLRQLWQVAALAAAVFVGVVAGVRVRPPASGDELHRLRADVRGLQETVAVSLLENRSAAQRLKGLQWSTQVTDPGDKLIDEVSETLRQDESVNVRLAAADVIRQFATRPDVRSTLHETVLTDPHPLVQVQLIDVMLVVGDPETQRVLRELLTNPDLNNAVRVKANEALTEMGGL